MLILLIWKGADAVQRDTQARLDHAAATISSLKRNVDEQETALETEQQSFDHLTSSDDGVNADVANSDATQSWHPIDAGIDDAPNDLPDRIQLIGLHPNPSYLGAP